MHRPDRNNSHTISMFQKELDTLRTTKIHQNIQRSQPNSAGHKPLKKYIVTVDSVEKRTNIDFFPALPDEVENRIEAERVQELP